jgi:hypothetical protein
MKKAKKNLILFIVFGTFYVHAFGQTNTIPQEPVTLPTPNVAALQMYNEVPVSNFTGVPNIEIPLYTLKEKEISVPISLSYHASGFRPDQHPGWVGQGWALQAGGVVSRVVHNLPDEDDELLSTDNYPIGFLFRHNAISVSNWSDPAFITNTVIGNGINYVVDVEPDEFDFTFAGHSGKFYMDVNGVYRAEGDKGIQITLYNPSNPLISCPLPLDDKALNNPFNQSYMHCFAGFIITTTDGTQYVFGGTSDAIEYSKDFYNQGVTTWIADSWHLTKIIGPDGSQVSFTYQRGQLINQLTYSVYLKSTTTSPTAPTAWYDFWTLQAPSCSSFSNPINSGVLPYSGKLLSPVYLSQISSEQATINFTTSATTELQYPFSTVYPTGLPSVLTSPSTYYYTSDKFYDLYLGSFGQAGGPKYPEIFTQSLSWQELDNISITKNDNSQVIKQFNFSYTHDANTRLTLLNLQEKSSTGRLIPPYQFYYDQSQTLPPYFARQNDHWGFWNDNNSTVTFNSSGQVNNPTGYSSLRDPNPSYALAGVLNRIIYPTGAVTMFTFEPNTYSSEVDVQRWNPLIADASDKYAGGLRIRKIITTDPNFPTQQKTREYFYLQNYSPSTGLTGRSSGVLGSKAQYYWPNYTIKDAASGQTTTITAFSSQSVLPASENSMGSHIGYSEVEEKNPDGSITDYQYTNFNANAANSDAGHLDAQWVTNLQPNASPYVSYNSKALERGKELSEQTYNSAGKIVKQTRYTYAAQTTDPIRALRANRLFTCNMGTLSYNEATAYYFYVYPFLPSSVTTTTFDSNGLNPQAVTKNMTYESNHAFLSMESFTDSKGRLVSNYYRYPSDLAAGLATATITQPLSLMVYKNMIGVPIETVQTKMLTGGEMVTAATVKTFKGVNVTPPSGTAQLSVKPALEYYFEGTSPFLKSGYINYNLTVNGGVGPPEQYQIDPNLKPRTEYSGFDSRGNVVQFNDNAANITVAANYFPHYTSFLWGYSKLFPIAKITNAGNTSLTPEFYAENFEESTATGVTADGTAHTGLKYMHAASFLVSWTPPNSRGYVISYWYKSAGIWKYSGEIAYTGTSYTIATGDGAYDDIRVYPADAQMDTYTYSSLLGMTSSIDPKGKTTFYEYDDFQRLMNIKAVDVTSYLPTIVKSYVYNYASNLNQAANWQNDGNTSCQVDANGNNTGYQQAEQQDINILSPTYGNTQMVVSGTSSSCPVTLTFTATNSSASSFLATFEGGPVSNVNVSIPAGGSVTAHIPVYSNYTLVVSPTGSPVSRTFVLGNHPVVTQPGVTFTGVSITSGNADLSLIIH